MFMRRLGLVLFVFWELDWSNKRKFRWLHRVPVQRWTVETEFLSLPTGYGLTDKDKMTRRSEGAHPKDLHLEIIFILAIEVCDQ
ncbi:hypothetical protein BgiMline_001925 [Biomphalaria glabrata]|nr:hypothetical protein BgiMline_001798 [Biomphalaria glabrata]